MSSVEQRDRLAPLGQLHKCKASRPGHTRDGEAVAQPLHE
jgi:hypothetical protein